MKHCGTVELKKSCFMLWDDNMSHFSFEWNLYILGMYAPTWRPFLCAYQSARNETNILYMYYMGCDCCQVACLWRKLLLPERFSIFEIFEPSSFVRITCSSTIFLHSGFFSPYLFTKKTFSVILQYLKELRC